MRAVSALIFPFQDNLGRSVCQSVMEDRATKELQVLHPFVLVLAAYTRSWFIPTAKREIKRMQTLSATPPIN